MSIELYIEIRHYSETTEKILKLKLNLNNNTQTNVCKVNSSKICHLKTHIMLYIPIKSPIISLNEKTMIIFHSYLGLLA